MRPRIDLRLIEGDALAALRTLPDDCVHVCVTSPPYLDQRDYEVEGQIGREGSVSDFIDRLVEVFREVRRVLHPSGTLFLNIGDTWYQKQMAGIPWGLALALQADGWWLRAENIWYKTNAQPFSHDDRPAPCHEPVFLLSKQPRYFFDQTAVRTRNGKESTWDEYMGANVGSWHNHSADEAAGMRQKKKLGFKVMTHPDGAKLRSVWKIPTEPAYVDQQGYQHHAAFPQRLVDICLNAGTSAAGCCADCLAPWVRVYEEVGDTFHGAERKRANTPGAELSGTSSLRTGIIKMKRPVGWAAGCDHGADTVPCTVLDCFTGTSTTGVVAARLMRNFIGIDLDPRCIAASAERLEKERPPLLSTLEVTSLYTNVAKKKTTKKSSV